MADLVDLAMLEERQREERALANRARMPETARIVDAFRAVFGDVVVTYAKEGEIELGTPGPAGVPLSDWTPRLPDSDRGA